MVTVAFVVSLLVHVPPVVGDNVMVLPIQTDAPALTTGKGLLVYVPKLFAAPTALVTTTVPELRFAGVTVSEVHVFAP